MSDEPATPKESSHNYNPIFETLVGKLGPESADVSLQGLIAYGLYKVSKREWVSELRAREGRRPTDAELDAYTRTWTSSQIATLRERAAQVLGEYASTVIETEEPRILRRALRGSFWRGVGPSIVASFIYTLLLIALALILARSGVDLIDIFQDMGGR